MQELNIKIQSEYKIKQAHKGDIGHDIRSLDDYILRVWETALIRTGVRLELPEGVECQVRPKSGNSSKGILVHFGTVDTEYRGEVMVTVTNLTGANLTIPQGYKIAQLVFKEYKLVNFNVVEEIDDNTERGTNSFGSTGVIWEV